MDPNECLKKIDDFIERGDSGPEVDQWCRDLMEWLGKAGFAPDWEKYPMGASYFESRKIMERRARENHRGG